MKLSNFLEAFADYQHAAQLAPKDKTIQQHWEDLRNITQEAAQSSQD